MAYIIFGVCAVLCILVIILAVKVIRENRRMAPKLKEEDEDDIWS